MSHCYSNYTYDTSSRYIPTGILSGNRLLIHSFHAQADRFYSPSSKVPGPGAYTVAKPSDWIRKTYPLPKNRAGPHRESVSWSFSRILHTH